MPVARVKGRRKSKRRVTGISRGHPISRQRTVFARSSSILSITYSLWCWYTDRGPVLDGLLSPFAFPVSFSRRSSRRYRRQTSQSVGGCSTPVRHDQYATLLFCYRAHPLSHSHAHARTHAHIVCIYIYIHAYIHIHKSMGGRVRAHPTFSFPSPTPFLFPCTSHRAQAP